jgi:Zn-finger nucleic acid-binding protein
VKACPRCFARIFHGSKHCNECGAAVVVPANANPDGSASALCCPRCLDSPPMEARLVGDTLMDECPSCHGVWLDVPAVERLVKERRQVSTQAVLGMGGPRSASAPVAPQEGRMYLKCPECSTVMNRTNFAKRSGIILDNCKNHGTWFDADELPRVVEFVMDGGVEAAQAAELRRMKEDARNERTKARAAAAQSSVRMDLRDTSREASIISAFGGLLDVIGGILSD